MQETEDLSISGARVVCIMVRRWWCTWQGCFEMPQPRCHSDGVLYVLGLANPLGGSRWVGRIRGSCGHGRVCACIVCSRVVHCVCGRIHAVG